MGWRAVSLADKEQVLEKKRGEPGAGQAISKTPGFRDLQFQGSLETLYFKRAGGKFRETET